MPTTTDQTQALRRARASRSPWWMAWTGRLSGYSLRVLGAADLDTVRSLLYSVYFEEQGWEPTAGNASGFRADHETRRMLDDLDEDTIWVGVSDRAGVLIGVSRIVERAKHGALEIERYVTLPPELTEDLAIVEANRLAIRSDHRSGLTLLLIHAGCAAVSLRLGAVRCFGAVSSRGADKLVAHHGWERGGVRFRYAAEDPEPVEVIYCERSAARQLRVLAGSIRRMAGRIKPLRWLHSTGR